MVADIGTRKGVKVSGVLQNSTWTNGLDWMSMPENNFPIFTVEQIKLDNAGVENIENELIEGGLHRIYVCQIKELIIMLAILHLSRSG